MSLRDCPLDKTPMEYVAEDPHVAEGPHAPATPVTDDFTVRCPKCGTTTKWSADGLRRAHAEAKRAKSSAAVEIRDALKVWGFAVPL